MLICGALRPGYSHLTDFISELGAQGSGHAALMNLAGFVPSGLLFTAFSASLRGELPGRSLSLVVSGLSAFFGIGMVIVGLYSCDPGCPQPPLSRAAVIHDRVSPAMFVAILAGIGLSAVLFRGLPGFRQLWLYSLLSSVLGFAFLAMLLTSLSSGGLIGLWQRLLLATVFLWYVVGSLQRLKLSLAHAASSL